MKTLTRSILLAGLALTVSACCGAAASTRDFYRITAYTTDGEVLTVSAMASPLGLNLVDIFVLAGVRRRVEVGNDRLSFAVPLRPSSELSTSTRGLRL